MCRPNISEINNACARIIHILNTQSLFSKMLASSLQPKNSNNILLILELLSGRNTSFYKYGKILIWNSAARLLHHYHGLTLHISFKAINNLINLNRLVFIIKVFGFHSKMTRQNTIFSLIISRVMALQKAMPKVQGCISS